MGNEDIKKKTKKYLGVTIVDNISPEKLIIRIIGNTQELLRNIKVAFTYIDEDIIKKNASNSNTPKIKMCSFSMVTKKRNISKECSNKISAKFK